MSGRGLTRNSKIRRSRAEMQDDESADTLANLERQAILYLEEELQLLTSTPGNFSEVSRVLKLLKEHRRKTMDPKTRANQTKETWTLGD